MEGKNTVKFLPYANPWSEFSWAEKGISYMATVPLATNKVSVLNDRWSQFLKGRKWRPKISLSFTHSPWARKRRPEWLPSYWQPIRCQCDHFQLFRAHHFRWKWAEGNWRVNVARTDGTRAHPMKTPIWRVISVASTAVPTFASLSFRASTIFVSSSSVGVMEGEVEILEDRVGGADHYRAGGFPRRRRRHTSSAAARFSKNVKERQQKVRRKDSFRRSVCLCRTPSA